MFSFLTISVIRINIWYNGAFVNNYHYSKISCGVPQGSVLKSKIQSKIYANARLNCLIYQSYACVRQLWFVMRQIFLESSDDCHSTVTKFDYWMLRERYVKTFSWFFVDSVSIWWIPIILLSWTRNLFKTRYSAVIFSHFQQGKVLISRCLCARTYQKNNYIINSKKHTILIILSNNYNFTGNGI